MKSRVAAAALILLLALSIHGQVIRGTPASVTSFGGNRTFVGGIPASLTSIAPTFPLGIIPSQGNTLSPCSSPGMLIPSALGCPTGFATPGFATPANGNNFNWPRGSFGGRHGRNQGFIPVYVPYSYPYGTYAVYDPQVQQPGQQPGQPVQVDIHIDDRRSEDDDYRDRHDDGAFRRERERERDERETNGERNRRPEASQVEPARAPEPPQEIIPAVLIFNDGQKREVRNYAIVGKVLYDLETMASRKIQLADVDLPATVKANEERGVDFTLPRY